MNKFSSLKITQNLNFIREYPYTNIFLIFLLSRIAILAIAIFAQQILPFIVEVGEIGITGSVNILDINLEASLNQLGKGDVGWYQSIIDNGYDILPFENTRQHNWAFFPFWPFIWWLFNQIIPSRIVSGVIAAHLFLLLALINLYRLSLAIGLSQKLANTSILLICFYPVSYFFSFPFTESLFLFLSTSFFYCCISNRWIIAGLFGAFASATRPTGILLAFIPIFYLVLAIVQKNTKMKPLISCFLLTISGLSTFMFHLYTITGNAFAFKDIQGAWGKESVFWGVTIYNYFTKIFLVVDGWDFKLLNLASLFMCVFLAVFLWNASSRLSCRIWGKLLSVFIVINLLMPASSGNLQSLSRYTLVIFPIFISLSMLIEHQKTLYASILIGFALLLGMMVTLYSFGFTLALC